MQEEQSTIIQHSKNIWLLIISLLLMAMGVYVIFSPETALIASALFIGVSFILMGYGYLMGYRRSHSFFHPIIGIIDITVGVILLVNLGITVISVPYIFGFWCLCIGITYLVEGMRLNNNRLPMSGLTMLVGVLGMLFGILSFLYPLFGIITITFMLGSYMIVYGAFELNRYTRD